MITAPTIRSLPYMPPFGGPLNWSDDQSGTLPRAVRAYYAASVGEGPALTAEQLRLIVAYCAYYIHAPCWRDETGELAALRHDIEAVVDVAGLDAWIARCLELAIDPL